MQVNGAMGEDVISLCQRLDEALGRKEVLPEDVDTRLSLLQPLEQALAAWPQFPDSLANRPSTKIAKLLWLKTHLSKKDPDFLLAQLQDQDPIVRITAVDALAVILGPSRQQWFDSGLSRRFRTVLEQQRKRETSSLIDLQLGQLIEQVRRFARGSRQSLGSATANPYVAGPPLRDKDKFFGRQDVLNEIGRTLGGSAGVRSIVIYGGRRTGKTSLLYRIKEGALGESFVPAYLDLQGLAGANLGNLLSSLQNSIEAAVREESGSQSDIRFQSESGVDFIFLQNFVENALGRIKDRSLLLMFDEYEILKDYLRDADVPRQLQHLLEGEARVFFIFAGSQKVEALEEKNFLILLDNSRYMKISFLKPEEARRLITQPPEGAVQFAEGVTEQIQKLCAGHPFYTQLICYSLFDMVQGTGLVTSDHVDRAVHELLENPAPHLVLGWNGLPLDQKITASALAALGRREQPLAAADVRLYLRDQNYPVRLGNAEVQQALGALRDSDWVEKTEGETRYRFTMDLVRRWIADYRSIWDLLREQQRAMADQIVGLGRRGLAFLIDLSLWMVSVWIGFEMGLLEKLWPLPFIIIGYYSISMLVGRATPGMFAVRIQAVSEAGIPLQPLRAMLLGTLISLPLVLISLFYVFHHAHASIYKQAAWISGLLLESLHVAILSFSKTHRGLFDKLAMATVVRRKESLVSPAGGKNAEK